MPFLLGQVLGNNPGKAPCVLPCSGTAAGPVGLEGERRAGTRPLKHDVSLESVSQRISDLDGLRLLPLDPSRVDNKRELKCYSIFSPTEKPMENGDKEPAL